MFSVSGVDSEWVLSLSECQLFKVEVSSWSGRVKHGVFGEDL